ncbi:hypothetical protein ACJX0J_019901, partial [Zea mays]
ENNLHAHMVALSIYQIKKNIAVESQLHTTRPLGVGRANPKDAKTRRIIEQNNFKEIENVIATFALIYIVMILICGSLQLDGWTIPILSLFYVYTHINTCIFFL